MDLSSGDTDDELESSSEQNEESNGLAVTSLEPDKQHMLDAFYEEWKKEVKGVKRDPRRTSTADARDGNSSGINECLLPVTDPGTCSGYSRTSSRWSEERGLATNSGDFDHPDTALPGTDSTEDEENINTLDSDPGILTLGLVAPDRVATPEWDTFEKKHISDLPTELLLRVLRWAVGSHLNTRVLGVISQVCHGFYFLGRDRSLWRSVCLRQWPEVVETGQQLQPSSLSTSAGTPLAARNRPSEDLVVKVSTALSHYGSWRAMAIRRPHLFFDGCYLCRISYLRTGSPDFQLTYNPVHQVVYHRGIRFHDDGRVEMLTTPSPPEAIVAHLGGRQGSNHTLSSPACDTDETSALQGVDGNESTCLRGTYKWCDPNTVVCDLYQLLKKEPQPTFRRRHRQNPHGPNMISRFQICFRVANAERRLHAALHWESYVIHTKDRAPGTVLSTSLSLSGDRFPTCRFVRVASYTGELSSEPL